MARQLLTATGDSHEIGPANFGRMVSDAREHAELVGQFFLGVQIGCANCHNHPLDRWTQDDYHGLAAIFSKMERGREVRLTTRGSVTNLRTNQPAIPRIPGARDLQGSNDHRQEVAAWLTSNENRYFARTMVNRLWQAMFGRGLVEPTNDLRETNPPTHPELLNQLAEEFATNGYSIRYMLRKISLANTYARDGTVVRGNSLDDRFYSRSYQRPLMPEVLNDAIADVTGVANDFQGHPFGTRAITIIDPLEPIEALDVLGRCSIAKGCNENSSKSGGLPAQLHLLNGDLLNLRLTNPLGRLQRMIAEGNEDNQMVQEFYMRAIARNPTDAESRHWCEHVKDSDAKKRMEKLEDFVWSLLNSSEFLENH